MDGDKRLAAGISARLSEQELRRFGITVAVPLALLAAVGIWRGHTILPAVLGGLAIVLGSLAIAAPRLLAPVQKVWMSGAHALGWFNTRVLLGVVYYLVMTPTGFLMRLVGRDPLDRRLGDRTSYWVQRKRHADARGSMEHRF